MTKNILFTLALALIGLSSFSQRGQRIAFVDMNYILENIPAYASAQDQLDSKVKSWQQNLDNIQREIQTMKTDLSNEKALLTQDLIAEKNEDIVLKEEEFNKLEAQYFSSDGNLFLLRKQLVTPIQDQVYNATQEIAKSRRYDFVFDKSSDLIMLYSTKQNDISELVLRSIVRGEKASKAASNKASRSRSSQANDASSATGTSEGDADATAKMSDRDLKRQEALKRIEQQKLDRAKKREDQKKALEEKRAQSSSKSTSEKPAATTSDNATPTEALIEEDANEVKISDREAKRQEALQRIEQQKLDRAKKREEQKKAIEQKRLERLKQREKSNNKGQENDTESKDTDSKKEDSIEEKEND